MDDVQESEAMQEDKIDRLERQISELTEIMRGKVTGDDPRYKEIHDNDSKIIAKLKRQINELIAEKEQAEAHTKHLKELIEKNKKDFPTKIGERDEIIKKLNEQVSVLKKEKNVIDETNVRLFSEIDYLQSDLKKLSHQLETKDQEVKQVRQMLENEKKLSEERLRKRLREFAQKETKKHVLLTVKIKELLDVVTKQREVIENINQADINLYELMNNTINQIKEERNSIDYSIVEKKLDDMSVDIASVSDLLEMPEDKIAKAIEESNDAEISDKIEAPEEDSAAEEKIRESVRRSIESGDSPELIKKSLVDSGEDEKVVDRVIEKELKEQRLDT